MARRGRFGRLPRQAPDLSGAIAALMREAQNQYDQNMVDAWKNGGKVDGKEVTDDMLLAHFKKRRDELDPSDPLWTEWNNRVNQYEYSIDESKLMVKWENGKVSESQVSQFYRGWAAKTDPNTEFYRTLMQNAGRWQRAADAKGAAGRARAAAEAHARWADNYYNKNVRPGETANYILVQAAIQYGAAPENAQDLSDINPNSEGYEKLMDLLDNGQTDDPEVQRIMNDGLAEIRKYDKDFTWSKGNVEAALNQMVSGARVLVKKSTGKDEANHWGKYVEAGMWSRSRVQEADELQIAFDAATNFQNQYDACHGEIRCQTTALTQFKKQLEKAAPGLVMTGEARGTTGPRSGIVGNTLRQVDAILDGSVRAVPQVTKTETTVDPITGKSTTTSTIGTTQPNLFDLMGGESHPFNEAGLSAWGEKYNHDVTTLQEGGIVLYAPQVLSDGQPAKDENGNYVLSQTVAPGDTPIGGTFRIDGVTGVPLSAKQAADAAKQMAAEQAYQARTGGVVGPAVRPPEVNYAPGYIVAEPMMMAGQSASSLGGNAPGSYTDPNATVGAGIAYHVIRQPDAMGKERPIYVTGDGTAQNPYLYHTQEPKYTNGEIQYVNGQRMWVFPVKTYQQGSGGGAPKPVIAPENDWAVGIRAKDNQGFYPPGTYTTGTGASTAKLLEEAWAKDNTNSWGDANTTTNDAISKLGVLAQQAAAKGERDYAAQLKADQRAAFEYGSLLKTGQEGAVLEDAFKTRHQYNETDQRYVDTLGRAGITIDKYGKEFVDQRVGLLKNVEQFERANAPFYNASGGGLTREQREAQNEAQQRMEAGRFRSMITDPNQNLYNLNIPGVRNFALENAMGTAAGMAWKNALAGIGGLAGGVVQSPVYNKKIGVLGGQVPTTPGVPGAPAPGAGYVPSIVQPPPSMHPFTPGIDVGFGTGANYNPPASYSLPYKPGETPPLVRPGEAAKPY